jgi:hypothetical protein
MKSLVALFSSSASQSLSTRLGLHPASPKDRSLSKEVASRPVRNGTSRYVYVLLGALATWPT